MSGPFPTRSLKNSLYDVAKADPQVKCNSQSTSQLFNASTSLTNNHDMKIFTAFAFSTPRHWTLYGNTSAYRFVLPAKEFPARALIATVFSM
jgi:hypothetical protein